VHLYHGEGLFLFFYIFLDLCQGFLGWFPLTMNNMNLKNDNTHAGSDLTNNGLASGAAAAALTFGVPAARALASDRSRRRLGARLAGIADGAIRLFDFSRGFKPSSALYAILTPVLFGAGCAYVAAPGWTLANIMGYVVKGRDSVFLWRNLGAALATLLPAMTYTLKEKSDADELEQTTPRLMNVGLLAASLGHLAVLGPVLNDGTGGKYINVAVGAWSAAAVASMVGLSAAAMEKA
jgi:hypothetical protein